MDTLKLVKQDGTVLAEIIYSDQYKTMVIGEVNEDVYFYLEAGPKQPLLDPDGNPIQPPG